MGTDCNICSNKCFGIPNHHGSCCTIDDRDYIIGSHSDADEFIKILSKKLGREIEREEIFVDYEEGKNMFPDKSNWQKQSSYPAFRVDFYNPRLPCIFYNTKIKSCSVYDIRPKTCRNYECEYLTNNTLK
jgi:Fe-S-cluster containining protein